ncbi:MAG: hypothetical protein EOO05_18675, partial [Chitinophagaceae bacterium]
MPLHASFHSIDIAVLLPMKWLVLFPLFLCLAMHVRAQAPICTTWTFTEQIASPAASEKPVSVVQLARGNFIVAGTDSSATAVRGRVLKLDVQGNVLLSRTISFPNAEFRIRQVRQFSDGRLYAIGTHTTQIAGVSTAILVSLDTATLTPLSSMKLDPGTGNGNWDAVDLGEGRDQSLIAFSTNGQLLNITRINYTTNAITWSRTYQPRLPFRAIGIAVEYGEVFVSWNEMDGGLGAALMMTIHYTDGTFEFGSRTGGSTAGFGYELHDLQAIANRPVITGLYTENGRYQAMRLNYLPTGMPNLLETFDVSGFTASPGMRSVQNDWEQTIALQAAGDANNVHFIKTFPDNYKTPITAFRINYPVAQEVRALAFTNDGGDIALANTVGPLQEILLTKTDSAGILPGCAPVPEAASFERAEPPYTQESVPAVPVVMQLMPLPAVAGDQPVNLVTRCRTLFCPDTPMPDSCLRTYFLEYRNNLNILYTRSGLLAGDGKIMLQSDARDIAYDAGTSRTQLTLVDTAGRVINSAKLVSPRFPTLEKIIKLKDGNFLGVGLVGVYGSSNMYAVKFDGSFNILWQTEYQLPPGPVYQQIRDVLESAEGDFFFYLTDTRWLPNGTRTLCKLDAGGNPVWIRQFDIGPTNFGNFNALDIGLLEMGNDVVMYYEIEADQSPILMRLRKTDASVIGLNSDC